MIDQPADLVGKLECISRFVATHGMPWMEDAMTEATNRIRRQTHRVHYLVSRPDLEAQIKARMTVYEIAEAHGCSYATVWRWLRMFGLGNPKRRTQQKGNLEQFPTRPWSEEEDDQLRALWDSGLPCSRIAEQLHQRSRNMVIGRIHRLGLPARKSPIKRAA